jgi:hypothetical protein
MAPREYGGWPNAMLVLSFGGGLVVSVGAISYQQKKNGFWFKKQN